MAAAPRFGGAEVASSKARGRLRRTGEEIRQGRRFSEGDSASGILEGYDVRFSGVAREHYRAHFGYARWFYGEDEFPVVQCLWPGRRGRFPVDPDFPEELRASQPSLAR